MKKLDPRSVTIGFLIAVIGFMSMGATNTTFDSITVGEIKMKSEKLAVRDLAGKTVLGITAGGPYRGLIVMDRIGNTNAIIGTSEESGGRITVYNAIKQTSISLYSTENQNGALTINNKWGENIFAVSATPEGEGYISLSDKHGEVQWAAVGRPN